MGFLSFSSKRVLREDPPAPGFWATALFGLWFCPGAEHEAVQPPVNAEDGRDHVDPDAQHDRPAAGGAVRHGGPGAGQHPGLPGAAGAAEPAGGPAGSDREPPGAGGAELRGGVPPGGAQEGSLNAGGTAGGASPVLQKQEESGGGEGGDPRDDGTHPGRQTGPPPSTAPPTQSGGGAGPGSRRGVWEEGDERGQGEAQAASPWTPQGGGSG